MSGDHRSQDDRARTNENKPVLASVQPAPVSREGAAEPWCERQRTQLTYTRRALFHQYNLVLLTVIAVSSLISGSLWVLLAGVLVELAMLATVPRLSAFRRRVDESLALIEQAEALRRREELLLQMSEAHREEFERLEFLSDRIRGRATKLGGDAAQAALDDQLGLDRLLASYIQLAIAHRAGKEFLALTDRRELELKLHTLEQRTVDPTSSDKMHKLERRRLAIARKRLERWDRNREQLRIIQQQLATIADLVNMVHEQSITPNDSNTLCDDIDQFMAEIEENEGTLRELAELCPSGDGVALGEPRVALYAAPAGPFG